MGRRHAWIRLLLLVALVTGGAACPFPTVCLEPPELPTPPKYPDPLELRSRLPGPEFVEVLEVRAFDDGLVMFCSGVRGLNIVNANNPSVMATVDQLASTRNDASYPRCQHLARKGDVDQKRASHRLAFPYHLTTFY